MESEEEARAPSADFGEHHDVVVVGGGVGGLTCGALLAKEGLDVLLVERHKRPGGYVTSYERNGYEFQVPHLVCGCGPSGLVTRVMNHLGAEVDFKRVEPFHRYVYPEHDITVRSDIEDYKETLKENFQPQTADIERFFKTVESLLAGMDLKMMRRPLGASTIMRSLVYPFLHPGFLRYMWGGVTLERMLDGCFSNDRLKAVVATPWPYLGSPPWELSALAFAGMLGYFSGGAYFPVGGYQGLSDALADSFVENGGTLLLDHEVTSINTEQGRISEVEIVPRVKVATETVVSDVDTRRTFLRLVDRENFSGSFLDRIEAQRLSMSGFVIHLGMARVPDEEFGCGSIFFQPSYDHRETYGALTATRDFPDPESISWTVMVHSMQDPGLAPEGGSCMDVLVPAVPYDFMGRWGVEEGGRRGEAYRSTKEKYAEAVVESVSRVFPGLIGDVEAYDVSTPISFERYTMAVDGCWGDSAACPGQYLDKRTGPNTPLRGLYVTGSKSVLGGGILPSILGGVLAADSVVRGNLGKLFQ